MSPARRQTIREAADRLATFIQGRSDRGPASVMQDFCQHDEVSRVDAELALCVLLNRGTVVVNQAMDLEIVERAAA